MCSVFHEGYRVQKEVLFSFLSKVLLFIMRNTAFVFVIGTVEYEMICCFCFQATSAKWINSVLKRVFNLWSRKWLKVTHSRVRYFMPLRLWPWRILLEAGLMKSTMLSLKPLKLDEFWIPGLSLFHSNIFDRKKVFLKKLCLIWMKGISLAFLVL